MPMSSPKAYHVTDGGDVIAENDPDEQQKRLRYNDMVASSVILQNTVDMMRILQSRACRWSAPGAGRARRCSAAALSGGW